MKQKEPQRPAPAKPELLPQKKPEVEEEEEEQEEKPQELEGVSINVDFNALKKAHGEISKQADEAEGRYRDLRKRADILQRWITAAERLWDYQRMMSEAQDVIEGKRPPYISRHEDPRSAHWPDPQDEETE
jgi:hypothetical protein